MPLEVEIHVERLRRLVGQKPQRLVERDRIRGQFLVGVPENEPPVRCIDHVELDHVDALSDRRGQRGDRSRAPTRRPLCPTRTYRRPSMLIAEACQGRSAPVLGQSRLRVSARVARIHLMALRAEQSRPETAPPIDDPHAVRRAFIEQRYRRVARLEHRRETKRAQRRFWILVAVLLMLAIFLSVTIWNRSSPSSGSRDG